MSDEELIDYTNPDNIARQNIAPNAGCNIDGKFYDVRNLVHLASSQADRIEALIAERDEARAAWELEASALKRFAERHERHLVLGAETRARAEAAEAKLAKAVDVLQAFNSFDNLPLEAKRPDIFEIRVRMPMLRTLAEIKGT